VADPAVALNHKTWRRALAIAAIVLGGLLLWLSPEQVVGVVTMVAGLALEAIGLRIDHV
jgi:hypothetical protein